MTAVIDAGEVQIEEDPPPPTAGQILTVFSPKGGTGKTAVATNLAAAFHARGKRVCLVDLDLEFGDVAVALSMDPGRTVADIDMVGEGQVEDAFASAITEYKPGFDCVLAPIDPEDAEGVSAAAVSEFLGWLGKRYEFVIVDTSAHVSDAVLVALDAADAILQVTTPEVTAIKALMVMAEPLESLHTTSNSRHLVVNMASDDVIPTAEIGTTLGLPVIAALPSDPAVWESINRGSPLVDHDPENALSQAIGRLALNWLDESELPLTETPSRRRMLRRTKK